jgi:hypothetical protein
MSTDTKKNAQEKAMGEFGLTSGEYFRRRWIYEELIPEDIQPRLFEIFKEAMALQHKNTEILLAV